MKLYTKIIEGVVYTLPLNKITLNIDGMQIFAPTEAMVKEDGWVEQILSNELTEDEIFSQTKQNLINDLCIYDSSKDVNVFYINNIPLWLDKITRNGLMLRLQAELSKNINKTSIWYNSNEFKLTVNEAINLLYSIEVYASKCYDTTQQHINNIHNITTMDELKNYNYKLNYPEKLFFKI